MDPIPNSVPPKRERLVSLDVLRGAIMLLMGSGGLGFEQIAKAHPYSALWQFLGYETDHVQWAGCALWDIIQPAFMFMVGVALPWSIANRRARNEGRASMTFHACSRALILILISVFLVSESEKRTLWIYTNVLAQIGLGYPFLFLLAFTKPRVQWTVFGAIMFFYWLAFALYPTPPADTNWKAIAVPDTWQHLTGFAAHWEKNTNVASAFDRWFLNLFPRETPFTHSRGGYQTLNFIPSFATMILGLIAGQWLRSDMTMPDKLKRLMIFGIAGVLLGLVIHYAGICPIVKRIWTPSWVLFSGGIVLLILAACVFCIDWRGWKRCTLPFLVAGLNPITLYILFESMSGFIRQSLKIHLGQTIFESFGPDYTELLQRSGVLLICWLIVYWMYRQKIFIRI